MGKWNSEEAVVSSSGLFTELPVGQPESAAVSISRACIREQHSYGGKRWGYRSECPCGQHWGDYALGLQGTLALEVKMISNLDTPQTQCKVSQSLIPSRSDLQWCLIPRNKGGKRGNRGGRRTGMLLETVGLLRPLIKSLYYCKDELAINSRMDRRQLRCERTGPKTVFYYLGDFCLNRSFQSQHECWAVKLCPCRNNVFWWKRQINCFVTWYWTHSIALLVLKSERLHHR